jgi:hypothetical protein
MITTQILAKVDNNRLQRAVDGVASNAYTIILAHQDEHEIRGFVANGDGHDYGVVLSEGQAFCGCKDSVYRKVVCKHATALALYAIRNPYEGRQAERKPSLKLAKVQTTEELEQDGFYC